MRRLLLLLALFAAAAVALGAERRDTQTAQLLSKAASMRETVTSSLSAGSPIDDMTELMEGVADELSRAAKNVRASFDGAACAAAVAKLEDEAQAAQEKLTEARTALEAAETSEKAAAALVVKLAAQSLNGSTAAAAAKAAACEQQRVSVEARAKRLEDECKALSALIATLAGKLSESEALISSVGDVELPALPGELDEGKKGAVFSWHFDAKASDPLAPFDQHVKALGQGKFTPVTAAIDLTAAGLRLHADTGLSAPVTLGSTGTIFLMRFRRDAASTHMFMLMHLLPEPFVYAVADRDDEGTLALWAHGNGMHARANVGRAALHYGAPMTNVPGRWVSIAFTVGDGVVTMRTACDGRLQPFRERRWPLLHRYGGLHRMWVMPPFWLLRRNFNPQQSFSGELGEVVVLASSMSLTSPAIEQWLTGSGGRDSRGMPTAPAPFAPAKKLFTRAWRFDLAVHDDVLVDGTTGAALAVGGNNQLLPADDSSPLPFVRLTGNGADSFFTLPALPVSSKELTIVLRVRPFCCQGTLLEMSAGNNMDNIQVDWQRELIRMHYQGSGHWVHMHRGRWNTAAFKLDPIGRMLSMSTATPHVQMMHRWRDPQRVQRGSVLVGRSLRVPPRGGVIDISVLSIMEGPLSFGEMARLVRENKAPADGKPLPDIQRMPSRNGRFQPRADLRFRFDGADVQISGSGTHMFLGNAPADPVTVGGAPPLRGKLSAVDLTSAVLQSGRLRLPAMALPGLLSFKLLARDHQPGWGPHREVLSCVGQRSRLRLWVGRGLSFMRLEHWTGWTNRAMHTPNAGYSGDWRQLGYSGGMTIFSGVIDSSSHTWRQPLNALPSYTSVVCEVRDSTQRSIEVAQLEFYDGELVVEELMRGPLTQLQGDGTNRPQLQRAVAAWSIADEAWTNGVGGATAEVSPDYFVPLPGGFSALRAPPPLVLPAMSFSKPLTVMAVIRLGVLLPSAIVRCLTKAEEHSLYLRFYSAVEVINDVGSTRRVLRRSHLRAPGLQRPGATLSLVYTYSTDEAFTVGSWTSGPRRVPFVSAPRICTLAPSDAGLPAFTGDFISFSVLNVALSRQQAAAAAVPAPPVVASVASAAATGLVAGWDFRAGKLPPHSANTDAYLRSAGAGLPAGAQVLALRDHASLQLPAMYLTPLLSVVMQLRYDSARTPLMLAASATGGEYLQMQVDNHYLQMEWKAERDALMRRNYARLSPGKWHTVGWTTEPSGWTSGGSAEQYSNPALMHPLASGLRTRSCLGCRNAGHVPARVDIAAFAVFNATEPATHNALKALHATLETTKRLPGVDAAAVRAPADRPVASWSFSAQGVVGGANGDGDGAIADQPLLASIDSSLLVKNGASGAYYLQSERPLRDGIVLPLPDGMTTASSTWTATVTLRVPRNVHWQTVLRLESPTGDARVELLATTSAIGVFLWTGEARRDAWTYGTYRRPGEWLTIALIRDGKRATFAVNGQKLVSRTLWNSEPIAVGKVMLGKAVINAHVQSLHVVQLAGVELQDGALTGQQLRQQMARMLAWQQGTPVVVNKALLAVTAVEGVGAVDAVTGERLHLLAHGGSLRTGLCGPVLPIHDTTVLRLPTAFRLPAAFTIRLHAVILRSHVLQTMFELMPPGTVRGQQPSGQHMYVTVYPNTWHLDIYSGNDRSRHMYRAAQTMSVDSWHEIALVSDGVGPLQVYYGGVRRNLAWSSYLTRKPQTAPFQLTVGAGSVPGTDAFRGDISWLTISAGAVPAQELTASAALTAAPLQVEADDDTPPPLLDQLVVPPSIGVSAAWVFTDSLDERLSGAKPVTLGGAAEGRALVTHDGRKALRLHSNVHRGPFNQPMYGQDVSYVRLPSFTVGPDFTLSFLFKPTSTSCCQPLFSAASNTWPYHDGDTLHSIVMSIANTGVSVRSLPWMHLGGHGLRLGSWNHVAVTVGGMDAYLYVNGRRLAHRSMRGLFGRWTYNFVTVGASNNFARSVSSFRGYLNTVAAFTSALSSGDVAQQAKAMLDGSWQADFAAPMPPSARMQALAAVPDRIKLQCTDPRAPALTNIRAFFGKMSQAAPAGNSTAASNSTDTAAAAAAGVQVAAGCSTNVTAHVARLCSGKSSCPIAARATLAAVDCDDSELKASDFQLLVSATCGQLPSPAQHGSALEMRHSKPSLISTWKLTEKQLADSAVPKTRCAPLDMDAAVFSWPTGVSPAGNKLVLPAVRRSGLAFSVQVVARQTFGSHMRAASSPGQTWLVAMTDTTSHWLDSRLGMLLNHRNGVPTSVYSNHGSPPQLGELMDSEWAVYSLVLHADGSLMTYRAWQLFSDQLVPAKIMQPRVYDRVHIGCDVISSSFGCRPAVQIAQVSFFDGALDAAAIRARVLALLPARDDRAAQPTASQSWTFAAADDGDELPVINSLAASGAGGHINVARASADRRATAGVARLAGTYGGLPVLRLMAGAHLDLPAVMFGGTQWTAAFTFRTLSRGWEVPLLELATDRRDVWGLSLRYFHTGQIYMDIPDSSAHMLGRLTDTDEWTQIIISQRGRNIVCVFNGVVVRAVTAARPLPRREYKPRIGYNPTRIHGAAISLDVDIAQLTLMEHGLGQAEAVDMARASSGTLRPSRQLRAGRRQATAHWRLPTSEDGAPEDVLMVETLRGESPLVPFAQPFLPQAVDCALLPTGQQALQLTPGQRMKVRNPTAVMTSTRLTVVMTVRLPNVDLPYLIWFGNSARYFFLHAQARHARLSLHGHGLSLQVAYPFDDKFHTLAITLDGANFVVYVDGERKGARAPQLAHVLASMDLRVEFGGHGHHTRDIAEIFVLPFAADDGEVAAWYKEPELLRRMPSDRPAAGSKEAKAALLAAPVFSWKVDGQQLLDSVSGAVADVRSGSIRITDNVLNVHGGDVLRLRSFSLPTESFTVVAQYRIRHDGNRYVLLDTQPDGAPVARVSSGMPSFKIVVRGGTLYTSPHSNGLCGFRTPGWTRCATTVDVSAGAIYTACNGLQRCRSFDIGQLSNTDVATTGDVTLNSMSPQADQLQHRPWSGELKELSMYAGARTIGQLMAMSTLEEE